MSSLDGRTVIAATMHENIFIPQVGDIRKELSNKDSATCKKVNMTISEPFLILRFESAVSRRTYTVPVPLTNFRYLVLESEVITIAPLK